VKQREWGKILERPTLGLRMTLSTPHPKQVPARDFVSLQSQALQPAASKTHKEELFLETMNLISLLKSM